MLPRPRLFVARKVVHSCIALYNSMSRNMRQPRELRLCCLQARLLLALFPDWFWKWHLGYFSCQEGQGFQTQVPFEHGIAAYFFSTSVGYGWARMQGKIWHNCICRLQCAVSRYLCVSNHLFVAHVGGLPTPCSASDSEVVLCVPAALRRKKCRWPMHYERQLLSCQLCSRLFHFSPRRQPVDRIGRRLAA